MSAATELTNHIIGFVYRQGGYVWRSSSIGIYDQKNHVYRTSAKKGVADIFAVFKGQLITIEVKIGKDRLSPEQTGFIKNVRHAGGFAFVVSDFEEFLSCWSAVDKVT